MTAPENKDPETTRLDTSKAVAPNGNSTQETTPVFDETIEAIAAAESHDKTDVDSALARETHDGKGDEDPGPSNWQGYATEGVENEEAD